MNHAGVVVHPAYVPGGLDGNGRGRERMAVRRIGHHRDHGRVCLPGGDRDRSRHLSVMAAVVPDGSRGGEGELEALSLVHVPGVEAVAGGGIRDPTSAAPTTIVL